MTQQHRNRQPRRREQQPKDEDDDYKISTLVGIAGSLVLGISVFLPWTTEINSTFGSTFVYTVNGFSILSGKIALLTAVLALVAFIVGDGAGELSLTGFVLGGIAGLMVLMTVSGGDSPSFGLMVAAVGVLKLLIAGVGNAIGYLQGDQLISRRSPLP